MADDVSARDYEMETFFWLCAMSAAMFFGSMMSGIIPLKLSISERKMKYCTIFGAGLLLGTAFSVIIPEGIETLYSSHEEETTHGVEKPEMGSVDKQIVPIDAEKQHGHSDHHHGDEGKEKRSPQEPLPPANTQTRKKRHVPGGHGHDACEDGRTPNINAKMGFSLVIGFMFMLLVDQVSSYFTTRGERAARGRLGLSATIGLVVHAAADGIAMGSASFSKEESLKFIVFFAIILHKMPAAFGLVTFLMSAKLPDRKVYKHLAVFSFAAPAAALATYFLVNWFYFLSSQVTVACLMLFSAGTFLYVATIHVFPELVQHSNEDESKVGTDMEAMIVDVQQPSLAGHSHSAGPSFSSTELLLIISGAILPGLSMMLIH